MGRCSIGLRWYSGGLRVSNVVLLRSDEVFPSSGEMLRGFGEMLHRPEVVLLRSEGL